MELKVVCSCGQKYKFDVEPVSGRMPFTVNCPICGVDGTQSANDILLQSSSHQSPPIPLAISAPAAGLRINRPAPETMPAASPPPLASSPKIIAPLRPVAAKLKLVWYEYLWIGLPLLLIVLGGAIGGACGGVTCALNRAVFQKTQNPILRYVWTGLISAAAFVAWFVIAAMLLGFLHRR